jgi:hypothetical protein
MLCEGERPNSPGGIQFGPQRIFVLHAAKTPWSGVLPERCHHERRLQSTVGRAPVPGTVKSELAIVAKRLMRPVRKRQRGLPPRIHAASQHEGYAEYYSMVASMAIVEPRT